MQYAGPPWQGPARPGQAGASGSVIQEVRTGARAHSRVLRPCLSEKAIRRGL